MELWIRSQDKKRLIKTNILELSTYEPNMLILTEEDIGKGDCKIFANEHFYIGTYKTKERALEVLNEIQNILQPRLIVHQPNIDYDDMIHSLTEDIYLRTTQKVDMELKQAGQVVYQMPKE